MQYPNLFAPHGTPDPADVTPTVDPVAGSTPADPSGPADAFDTAAAATDPAPGPAPPREKPTPRAAVPASPPAGPADRIGEPAKRVGPKWWHTVVAAFLGGALAIGGAQVIADDPAPTQTVPAAQPIVDPAPPTTAPPVTDEGGAPVVPLTPAPAADAAVVGTKVIPSIVTVQVGSGGGRTGSGSGVIASSDGFIVTNNHVIEVGSEYQVVLSDGRTTYDAALIGADPLTDLAVLKIDAADLTPIELGATATLTVGDVAIAVGSPLGLEGGPSLTVGVVSAFGRQVQTGPQDMLYGMLQTDAPITQGSSGGALVDGDGRLIGITTAVGVSSVGVEGIGFATPVEIVRRVIDELVAEGSIAHAFLGITGSTGFVTADDGARVAAGVQVESVESGSAADVAGIVQGDLITAIDGQPVATMDELIVALRVRAAGDEVLFTVDGRDLPATLGTR
jgi:putative serine protease PepD